MHVINVEVKAKPNESSDRLIKRFIKKCKKQDIVKEYLGRVSFAQTRSQKLRAKRLKNKYLRKIDKF
jgi:ribosomal protein S21